MDIKQIIEQVFMGNLGNRITPELAAGMVRTIAMGIVGSMQGVDAQPEAQATVSEQEADDGVA